MSLGSFDQWPDISIPNTSDQKNLVQNRFWRMLGIRCLQRWSWFWIRLVIGLDMGISWSDQVLFAFLLGDVSSVYWSISLFISCKYFHLQGGYSTNLAPAKLVGKLFTSIDRSIHRMIGTPPPLPSPSQSGFLNGEQDNHSKVANSKSTMEMSSLVPSASMEPISELTEDKNRMTMHNRSISEPDFGRSPKQVDFFWQ